MNGKVKIENGVIIIKNPDESGEYASITPPQNGTLYVNGEEKKGKTFVKAEDIVEFNALEVSASKEFKIEVNKDKTEAYILVDIKPGKKYSLVDTEESSHIDITLSEYVLEVEENFSESEIYNSLRLNNINYGIKNDLVKNFKNIDTNEPILIAEGKKPINAEDDSIKFSFESDDKIVDDNSMKNIDYKNINRIQSVNEGECVAKIIRGYESQAGIDVYGIPIYAKKNKRKVISTGKGCTIKDDLIIATKGGQISYKNGQVSINDVYNLSGDVDIKSGNIKFPGDVNISGNSTEGMTVFALNDINIGKNAYKSNIIALGDIYISGSVINSKVVAGGEDVTIHQRINNLNKLKEILVKFNEAIQCLQNSMNSDYRIGTIAKMLIDTKFTEVSKICKEVMVDTIKSKDNNSQVLAFIKNKLMGNNVVNIEDKREIVDAIRIVDEEIASLQLDNSKSSSIIMNYCQESEINASGDVVIKGKGVFSTDITSLNSIIFEDKNSVCRGGSLRAKNLIKAGIVGSESEIQTVLEVENKDGEIFIEIVYNNTVITIGDKSKVVNREGRNVHCYINKERQLVIDKFVL